MARLGQGSRLFLPEAHHCTRGFFSSRKAKNWLWDYAKPIRRLAASLSVTFFGQLLPLIC
jgi:hypothetical protein